MSRPIFFDTGGSMTIGAPVVGGTPGSILFVDAGGNLGQDNAALFWDEASGALGIGTNAPNNQLHVVGSATFTVDIAFTAGPGQHLIAVDGSTGDGTAGDGLSLSAGNAANAVAAAGGTGGFLNLTAGNGGNGAVALAAGVGGSSTWRGGTGGNSTTTLQAGAGGALAITSGTGGTSSATGRDGTSGAITISTPSSLTKGGDSGTITFSTGNGSTAAGVVGSTPGTAGNIVFTLGTGGAAGAANAGRGGSILGTAGTTGTNAISTAGGDVTWTGGVGGAATGGATSGTAGGASSVIGGVGGVGFSASGGTGGAANLTGGAGAAQSGTASAGVGGTSNVTGGRGGTGSAAVPGGVGGVANITGGQGGAAGGGGTAGVGADVVITGGAGGAAGIAGGNVNFVPGATGAGVATGSVISRVNSNLTNTVYDLNVIRHTTSGAAAASFGVGQLWQLENSAGTQTDAQREAVVWTTATAANEVAEARWFLRNLNGLAAGNSALPTTATWAVNGTTGGKVFVTDSATNTTPDLYIAEHRSTGVATTSFGASILFRGQDDGGTAQDLGRLSASWSSGGAVAGSPQTAWTFQVRNVAALGTVLTINRFGSVITGTQGSFQAGTALGLSNSSGDLPLQSGSTAGSITFNAIATVAKFKGTFSSGTNIAHDFTPRNMTAQTASVEGQDFKYTHSTKQWATGALTIQRAAHWTAPTFSFVGASTLTNAISFAIESPIAGTNATFTSIAALLVGATAALGPSSAGFNYTGITVPAHTITVTGATNVTSTVAVAGLRLDQITIENATAINVNAAATLYLAGAPIGGGAGPATLLASYVLWADAGLARFDGDGTNVFELPNDATVDVTAVQIGRVGALINGVNVFLHTYDK